MAARPSGRFGPGGGACGLKSRLRAMPQWAIPHSGSASSTSSNAGILQLRANAVVERVGLEPTTRVLWNVGVSDQLPWSDTYALAVHARPRAPGILLFWLIFQAFLCGGLWFVSDQLPWSDTYVA